MIFIQIISSLIHRLQVNTKFKKTTDKLFCNIFIKDNDTNRTTDENRKPSPKQLLQVINAASTVFIALNKEAYSCNAGLFQKVHQNCK